MTTHILALDPSSTCTGWALLADATTLVEWGLLRVPAKVKPPPLRARGMAQQCIEVADRVRPAVVVVEYPNSHVQARHGGHGAGLAVYGAVVGYVCGSLRRSGYEVREIDVAWKSRTPKARIHAIVQAEFEDYDPAEDTSSGDGADAIALGAWFLREEAAVRLRGGLA